MLLLILNRLIILKIFLVYLCLSMCFSELTQDFIICSGTKQNTIANIAESYTFRSINVHFSNIRFFSFCVFSVNLVFMCKVCTSYLSICLSSSPTCLLYRSQWFFQDMLAIPSVTHCLILA